MKIRHVRAVAVAAVAAVALTGARQSGGGCDDNSGGSGGGTTTGGSSAGAGASSGSADKGAAEDLRIESCEWNGSELAARVRATNRSASTTYTYTYKLTFSGFDGKTLDSSHPSIPAVLPGRSAAKQAGIPYDVPDNARLGEISCKLTEVERTAV